MGVTGTIKHKEDVDNTQENQENEVEATEETATKERPNHFRMIKNAVGSLVVNLEPADFSMPARKFRLGYDQDYKVIPSKWAVGVFVSESALKQMELGYFTFENLDVLVEMAEEMGHYVPDSIKNPKISVKDMKKALRSGDVKALDNVMLNASAKNIKDLIALAKSMHSRLNVNMVQHIENTYNVSLAPVDLG